MTDAPTSDPLRVAESEFPEIRNERRGLVELWKAIIPLTTIASAMNTGAHPDDEHSAMLAYLSLGKGVHTSSVIATRGEGGQNEIGSELGHALGIIRTRELEEASRLNHITLRILSEELDDPITDFGFSKCERETLNKWGESVCYERLIRQIRLLRPDVVIPCFRNERTTHGHHRAITILTLRAYQEAADPAVFPEHAASGLQPWQIKKLYVPGTKEDYQVAVPIGEYSSIYGATYRQLGEQSRFLHRSQGMGVHYEEGAAFYYYKREAAQVPAQQREPDFFAGLAYTFADLADELSAQQAALKQKLRSLQAKSAEVIAAFPDFQQVAIRVHQMLGLVEETIAATALANVPAAVKTDLLHRLRVKKVQLQRASCQAVCLVPRLKANTDVVIPGQKTEVTLSLYNGGQAVLKNIEVKLLVPDGWQSKPADSTCLAELDCHSKATVRYELFVPADAEPFHPLKPDVLQAVVRYQLGETVSALRLFPERYLAVLPPYSIALSPQATVWNTSQQQTVIPVKTTVRNYRSQPSQAVVSLDLPPGWQARPETASFAFSFRGETQTVSFLVSPDEHAESGHYRLKAKVESEGFASKRDVQVIEYEHIGRTYYIRKAELGVQAFDLQLPERLRVGYVSSGFDNIDSCLRELGVNIVNLDAREIECGDLSRYDTIVLGIRAYAFRPELIRSNPRLLRFVENGGNLVVQYHKPGDGWKPELAPYPITLGDSLIDWRVTNENSRVTVLAPEHPIFNWPNRIGEEDWANWVQERSIYNPAQWSERYTELISTGDDGEPEFRGIFLTAPYGKGVYTYSSLAWFREIPQLVPGAIRLFVNMISLKQ
ncbi:PIG-L family deacetylase [Brevibacillus fulvus]|uniref:LmbE family N-acetylglucosaminyl deacetylase n=1 Tax=Brevibacillus fulvus TaxID=1125967 RepID=A0A938Y2Z5_9BACL|nr:PIG-L family deacetylase [Brevibacillus fulvus]MBM7590682.1 LmbE family N-acetylglucosaminyl deacetylase [Brevibacillus fulvus]